MYQVYPETKGVPLEEMDRVFGEGKLYVQNTFSSAYNQVLQIDELEEQMDNESERASLMSHILPIDRDLGSYPPPRNPIQGWFSSLLSSRKIQPTYEPIAGGD